MGPGDDVGATGGGMYIPHTRISAIFEIGPMGAPKETASCTLNFKTGAVLTSVELARQTLVDDAFNDWKTWIQNTDSKVCDSVWLKECRLYAIDADGHSMYDTAHSTAAAVQGSSSSATNHPWQITNVVSLVAGTRGKGRFGRIYLPPQAFQVDRTTNLIQPTDFNAMWGTAQTLLDSLSNRPSLDEGWGLVVAGKTGTGTLRDVTEIRMGHVADTQRRRRRAIPEGYATAAFSS